MRVLTLLATSVILKFLHFTEAVSFVDCGSRGARPTSVDVRPCNDDPCTLTKGSVIGVTIGFMATASVTPGGALIRGTSAGAMNRLPIRHNGVCGRVVPPCPIQIGETYNYYYTGLVPRSVRIVSLMKALFPGRDLENVSIHEKLGLGVTGGICRQL
ncbi:Phosphatidylglycerol/phosphatidylinositol transfer protein [Clonorchis sinensis]|uniref:Phosphatidylglycerol/phosphatidylinositol transfer protein n=1 Tax=Clonorchis sinensis TaxID=79923 RepID=A0A8T1MWN4_CLOSI|nr:Phosphatidylglycerol/phosphatidylinositol transfer protein [Clonorchis sinensis]